MKIKDKSKGFFAEFKKFALKGSVIDLAVGVIIGAAFQKIVNSLVNDIVMPFISTIFKVNFSDWKLMLREAVLDAEGAVVTEAISVNYGTFISEVLNFIILAFVIFMLVRTINKAKTMLEKKKEEEPAPAPAKEPRLCPYCRMEIADDATRCGHCTSVLDK